MAMNINDRLASLGWDGDRNDFNDLLAETLHAYSPGWTDEQLLCRPRNAMEFCDIVRRRGNCPNLPDDLILRALVNIRRKGDE